MLVIAALALAVSGAATAAPPAERLAVLQRGVNVTNWFRFPASLDPAALRAYLSDAAVGDIHRAGFGFVRLPVQPEMLMQAGRLDPIRLGLLLEAVHKLQRQGLGVVIVPHPSTWRLDNPQGNRALLTGFWHALAPELARTDPRLTFVEVLNEPVFAKDAEGWADLQVLALSEIRAALPLHTVILTGSDWGGVGGLLALRPVADRNVVYSIHFYDPSELTSLAAYRPGLDTAALARLPFPMDANPAGCAAATGGTDPATADLIGFVCALQWDTASVRRRIGEAGAWARRNNATVLLGEFGASVRLNAPARLAWLAAVRRAAEQEGMGWALWGYDDGMGLDVPRPPGRRPILDGAVLQALGVGGVSVSGAQAPELSPRRSAR